MSLLEKLQTTQRSDELEVLTRDNVEEFTDLVFQLFPQSFVMRARLCGWDTGELLIEYGQFKNAVYHDNGFNIITNPHLSSLEQSRGIDLSSIQDPSQMLFLFYQANNNFDKFVFRSAFHLPYDGQTRFSLLAHQNGYHGLYIHRGQTHRMLIPTADMQSMRES